MKTVKVLISSLLCLWLCSCASNPPKEVQAGVVKLNAAVQLVSPHNARHCALRISEIEAELETNLELEVRRALLEELELERQYLEANQLLPSVVEELKRWALGEEDEPTR